jgi:hypothetical protein
VKTSGHRRLALVVGVGKYEAAEDLEAPARDAARFAELLTARDGYSFPEENVCVLADEEATTARFREAFQKALVARVKGTTRTATNPTSGTRRSCCTTPVRTA